MNLIYITLNRLRKDHVIKKALQLLWHLPFFPIVGLPCPSYQLRKCSEKGAIRILEIFRLSKKNKAITWQFRPQAYWKYLPWDYDRVLRFQPIAQQIIQMGVQWNTVKIARYSRVWNRRSPLNKHSPWNIWPNRWW